MGKARHILVADDDARVRNLLTDVLSRADYSVTAVADGEKALKALLALEEDAYPFDLLIAAVPMPELTGVELLEEMRKWGIDIPVVAVSGKATRETVLALKALGCQEIVVKPFSPGTLLERVRSAFRKHAVGGETSVARDAGQQEQ